MWYLYGGILCGSLVILFIVSTLSWLGIENSIAFITDSKDRKRNPLLEKLISTLCFGDSYPDGDTYGAWLGIILISMFLWPLALAACIITSILLISRHYTRCKKEGKPFKFKDIY